MQLKEKLSKLRKNEGLTQAELADTIKVSLQDISRWEMGTAIPNIANVLAISKVFNVTTDYLINDKIGDKSDSSAVKDTRKGFEMKHKYILVEILLIISIITITIIVGITNHCLGETIIILQIIVTMLLIYHGIRFLKSLLQNNFSNNKR